MFNVNDKQKAFQLYKDSYDLIACLSNEQAGQLLKAIFELECFGADLETDDQLLKMAWIPVRRYLLADSEKYKAECEKRKLAQIKRWAKESGMSVEEYIWKKEQERQLEERALKLQENTSVYSSIQHSTDKDKDKETDTDRVRDNESEKDRGSERDSKREQSASTDPKLLADNAEFLRMIRDKKRFSVEEGVYLDE